MSLTFLLLFKSLHVIFVVTWFAYLFYIVRLFVYQTEANEKEEPERTILIEQLKIMSKRLSLIIGWPSAILSLIFGSAILFIIPDLLEQKWFQIKLGLVAGLFIYHFILHFKYKELQKDIYKYSSAKLRILNEVSTIFLFTIIFLVIYKSLFNLTYFVIGAFILMLLLYLGIILYKKRRRA
jgi:protoporphyrinogen IX oxidase